MNKATQKTESPKDALIAYLHKHKIDFELKGDNLTVGGSLGLQDCTGITALPDNLTVGGSLDLSGTGITALPDNLTVGGSLYLRGTGITALPDNLTVGGSLYLSGTGITALPDNLTVGGSLGLQDCTGITALPDNLTVGGSLYLRDGLLNVAYKKNCGNQNRTIFAAWVNGEIQIGAGCFLGPIQKFFDAVGESYSGGSAKKYKDDAQSCIDSLVKKLNKSAA